MKATPKRPKYGGHKRGPERLKYGGHKRRREAELKRSKS